MKHHSHFILRAAITSLRALALLLSLLLALTACSEARPIRPSKQDTTVVASCAGFDICYDELRYVACSYRDQLMRLHGDDYFSPDSPDYRTRLSDFTQAVEEALADSYVVLATCRTYGITVEDEEITKAVQSIVEQTIHEAGGRGVYKQLLDSMYMTDRFVRFTLAVEECKSALCRTWIEQGNILRDESEFLAYALDGNFCATYHVFIANDEGEDIDANRARAHEARQKMLDGKSIESMLGSIYNEDLTLSGMPYYFTYGEYDPAYEQAAFALEIGEMSEVVETEQGFYIIVRQPLDEAYMKRQLAVLLQQYQYAATDTLLSQQSIDTRIVWNDYGATLTLTELE